MGRAGGGLRGGAKKGSGRGPDPAASERGPDPAALRQPSRLAAVARARRVLTGSGVPLDRLAGLTARAARAPLAAISLLDADLEYFVAAYGTDRTEVPRSMSLCQFVISANEALVIGDTTDADGPPVPRAVSETGLMAYIGVPLHLDGVPIGAFCVADLRPRQWAAEEVAGVNDAAGVVTALLAGDLAAQDVATAAAETDTVVDAMREAFLAVSPDGVILRWSAGAEGLFGWATAEAVGRDADRLIVARRSRSDYAAAVARAGRQAQTSLLWLCDRDGEEFPVDASISMAEVAGGRRVYLFLRDISDRIAAERETARHRGFLEALLESLDAGVAACDAQGRPILSNRALREMYGLPYSSPADQWPDRLEIYHPDGRPMEPEELPLFRALAGEPIRDEPAVLRRAGQRMRHFRVNGSQLRSAESEDELLGAVIAVHEVTNLVLANRFKDCELAVSRVLEREAPLVDTARDVLAAVGATLQWPYTELWLVEEETSMLRLTAASWAPGREVANFGPDRLALGQGLAGGAWRRGAPVWLPDLHTGQTLISADGVSRSGLYAAVAVPVRSGEQILGVLAFFADTVEEPHDALEALLSGVAAHIGQFLERRRAAQLTAELARAKDEYVGLVGHELRTPLTSISAYTDLLIEDPALADDQRQMLEVVQRNAATLRGIIADLLDLAALDAGHSEVRPRPTNLADVVRDALEAAAPDIARQRLAVVADIASALVVAADATRMRQVVDNLLGNAVKYTPPGGKLTVRLKREADVAVLTVADTGPGIPAIERAKLFGRFFRGSAAKASRVPGSGLGLAIARAIVDKHGGTIAAAERDGPGATFVVRLPGLSGSP